MLKEKLQKELNDSLKSGDKLRRLVLGMLMTAIQNREIVKRTQLSKTVSEPAELEKKSTLNDEEIIEAIAGEVKKRKESIEQFKAGGRQELVEKETKEMEILAAYLPEQLSETEITTEIDKVIKETGAAGIKDVGKVIGQVMAKMKGRADGSIVSKITKEKLSV